MSESKKRKKPRRAVAEATPKGALAALPTGLLAAVISAVVMMAILAGVSLACHDAGTAVKLSGYASLYVPAFIGGFFACRRCNGMPLLCGLLTGGAMMLLTLMMAPLIGEGIGFMKAFLTRLPLIPIAILGGLAATYIPKRRVRRRR